MTDAVVGVDATRNRSGGAIAHLRGLVSGSDPRSFGISTVHLWAHDALLEAVDDPVWLEKHPVSACRKSLAAQIWWQRNALAREARRVGVDVMFNTDAGSVCTFQPSVTLSQDMLSFEAGEINRYPWWTAARIRLEVLRHIQRKRLASSSVALFLTKYAQKSIMSDGRGNRCEVIPHGVDDKFFSATTRNSVLHGSSMIRCVYVSNAAPYKHQWHVVDAVSRLRQRTGLDVRLRLVGGGRGAAMDRLLRAVAQHDPDRTFVELEKFIPNDRIPAELAAADIFVYASSCENLPITLLEAMAAGVPIAASSRGPMPEVLGDGGVYFDPELVETIVAALSNVISDEDGSQRRVAVALDRAKSFSWSRSSASTWQLLASVAGARTI